MEFTEKDLEDLIYNNYPFLEDVGIDVRHTRLWRQVNLGVYGIADLIGIHLNGNQITITIYELKKGLVDITTLFQAIRYVKGVNRILDIHYRHYRRIFNIKIQIILIGSSVDLDSEFVYLPDVFQSLRVYTYEFGFRGLEFYLEDNYNHSNDGNLPDYRDHIQALRNYQTTNNTELPF